MLMKQFNKTFMHNADYVPISTTIWYVQHNTSDSWLIEIRLHPLWNSALKDFPVDAQCSSN